MCHTYLNILCVISIISFATARYDLQSPCPRLFVYEPYNSETDRWYGIATLLMDSDLYGVWLRLIFDKKPLQIGNWYGDVVTISNEEYEIVNVKERLNAHNPLRIRFFVRFDPAEAPPKLVSFRISGIPVCPERPIVQTTTMSLEIKTSNPVEGNPKPPKVEHNLNRPTGNSFGQQPLSSGNDEFDDDDIFDFIYPPAQNNFNEDSDINEICGTVVVRPKPLITYGQSTYEGEFPWHVALYHARGSSFTYICGSSLISHNFVITVAHCVAKRRSCTPLNPANLIVYLGKYYLTRYSNTGIQNRHISEIIIHPNYFAHNYSNDIALLKLEQPAEFTDYVRPVCLWEDPIELSRIVRKHGHVVGWGFDETGSVTEELNQAEMPVVSQQACLFSYRDFYSRFISENTLCAGFRNGTSVCNGDSGGGMVFPKSTSSSKNPVWQLRGLVSVSVVLHDKFKCDASHYVIFTDTAKYLDWIKIKIK